MTVYTHRQGKAYSLELRLKAHALKGTMTVKEAAAQLGVGETWVRGVWRWFTPAHYQPRRALGMVRNQTRIKPLEPVGDCVHRWILEPQRISAMGVCKLCGAMRLHNGGEPEMAAVS